MSTQSNAARTIKVFTDVQALNAVKANPNGVLGLTVKKDRKTGKPKEYQGTIFMNATYTIGAEKNDGWFVLTEDVPLSRGVADPLNKDDKRNQYKGTRNQLEMKLSQAGSIGQFFDLLNEPWKALIQTMNNAKEIPGGSARKLHELLQYTLSADNVENPGAKLDDPILRFQVNEGVFSKDYPYAFLRGQPKTVFLDYRTRYIDEQGKEQFKLASFKDDSGNDILVTVDNMHKFITNGSVLKRGSRIMVPSGSRSKEWISLPVDINKAIIEPRSEVAGFSDELPVDMNALKAALPVATRPLDTTAPAQAPTVTPTVENKQVDEISSVLDQI